MLFYQYVMVTLHRKHMEKRAHGKQVVRVHVPHVTLWTCLYFDFFSVIYTAVLKVNKNY